MILNITCNIYTDNNLIKRFFNLDIKDTKNVEAVKKAILDNLDIDENKYIILKDGIVNLHSF